ncbi:MAG: ferredoxin family protein [Arenicella sp.]|nr:ferredoxin family protein [Arenicella sp.]
MTYVIGENCVKCKYTSCVEICPVDAFCEANEFLVIDPDTCIDCSACEPECPAEAIFHEKEMPHGQQGFIALNAALSKKLEGITRSKAPLDDANAWLNKESKSKLISFDSTLY